MSVKTKGWLIYAFLVALFYAGVSFTQLNSDFTIWSVTARTVFLIGVIPLWIVAMFIADPPELK
ncbi:hypothetical protein [Mucilaginibacter polytrichastri]|uniref:hypothetical protein n=1 Tax=Mucilaginibacter polytrichastri TaxID=1302689 RepID=UPI0008EC0E0E|nr:hypothetical protein [Mucilaginibacter polytrichastri]SFS98456.1 hypothetical protein SAMN04487890_107276 [Mucilaginibacter polytrichastri]